MTEVGGISRKSELLKKTQLNLPGVDIESFSPGMHQAFMIFFSIMATRAIMNNIQLLVCEISQTYTTVMTT